MYTKRLKIRDPYDDLIPPPPKIPTVIEQRGGGYILKELTEEEFWELGRQRYYVALREVNEQARVAEERKRIQMNNERVNTLSASIFDERQREKQIAANSWQLELGQMILDRGVGF